jgi:hypothetical protein
MSLAIYLGTKYVVREYDESRAGLWAYLGPNYDRAKAGRLADCLNREREEQKDERRAIRIGSDQDQGT